jgi:hypothetical protein
VKNSVRYPVKLAKLKGIVHWESRLVTATATAAGLAAAGSWPAQILAKSDYWTIRFDSVGSFRGRVSLRIIDALVRGESCPKNRGQVAETER